MSESEEFVPPRPWRLEPLYDKFNGTSILDARGRVVCTIWLCAGPPSPREDMDTEDICDSHYESMADWQTATLICDLVNASVTGSSAVDRG